MNVVNSMTMTNNYSLKQKVQLLNVSQPHIYMYTFGMKSAVYNFN